MATAEAIAFDTHRFVKHLTQVGFTLGQAEALAEEQVNLINSNLATKADIATVEAALKADIATVEAALKADIAAVETALKADIAAVEAALKTDIATIKADTAALKVDLLKWMFGALIAQGGLIVALVKLL